MEFLPPVTYYKPAGVPLRELDEVILAVEEFEALRLKDMDGLEQVQCAERMGIARTTFQRILYAARYKVAEALVDGKAIRIEGGAYVMPKEHQFQCAVCGSEFEASCSTGQRGRQVCCPNCGQGPARRLHNRGRPGRGGRNGFRGGCRHQKSDAQSLSSDDKGDKPEVPEDDD